MKSILYYFEAKQRLKLSRQTIDMMGGEKNCDAMLLGQRDILELEVEYYRKEAKKNTVYLLTFTLGIVILFLSYRYGVFW